MSSTSIQMELTREFILEKVRILEVIVIDVNRCVSWRYLTFAWGQNTGFYINFKKCLEKTYIQDEIGKCLQFLLLLVSIGMVKQ